MDEARKRVLQRAGIDVEDALGRFMGNEELMMQFLLKFPQDPNFPQLKEAMAHGDADRAFAAAHTLKGVTGNLSMKALSQQVGLLVEDLRGGDFTGASGKMGQLEELYHNLTTVLEEQRSFDSSDRE